MAGSAFSSARLAAEGGRSLSELEIPSCSRAGQDGQEPAPRHVTLLRRRCDYTPSFGLEVRSRPLRVTYKPYLGNRKASPCASSDAAPSVSRLPRPCDVISRLAYHIRRGHERAHWARFPNGMVEGMPESPLVKAAANAMISLLSGDVSSPQVLRHRPRRTHVQLSLSLSKAVQSSASPCCNLGNVDALWDRASTRSHSL